MKILVWTTIRLFSKGGFPGVLAAKSPPAGFLATEPPGKSWLLISLSSARTLHLFSKGSFSGGSANKEPACNTGDSSLIPGLGRSPGKGNGYPLQHSGLESSMGSTVHGVAKGRTWLSDFHFYPASLAMPSSITHTRLAPLLTQWLSHTLQLTEAAWFIPVASGITGTFFLSPVKFSRYQRLTLHKSSQRVKFKDLSSQKESAKELCCSCWWTQVQPRVSPSPQTHSGSFSLDYIVGRWWFCVLVFNVFHPV